MRKTSTKLVVLALSLISFNAIAQTAYTGAEASKLLQNATEVSTQEGTNTIASASFERSGINAKDFFAKYKLALGLGDNDKFELKSSESDAMGYTHYRFQQYYKNIPVEGGEYILAEKNGSVVNLNGAFYKNTNTSTTKALNENSALEAAKLAIGAKTYKWEVAAEEAFLKISENNQLATYFPKAKLVLVNTDFTGLKPNFRTAYKFDIYADKPMGRYYAYVDASTGAFLGKVSRICNGNATGTATTLYNGNQTFTTDNFNNTFRLRNNVALTSGRKIETYDMKNGTNYSASTDIIDADNNWTTDKSAYSAHYGAEATYDYFFNKFNRNSFDNAGGAIKSYVHYDKNYVNAYWDGTKMTYGDGDGTSYSALTSLDVCGHEITHAVTERTSNLAYQNESGALNESFSDVFGTAVEFFKEGATGDWLIGEDFDIKNHTGFRSMSNPKANGQPDYYKGTNWVSNSAFPNLVDDYGGVHTNSGVQNFWFYLLTVGKNGTNEKNIAYNVFGIGIDKAAAIAFRCNTTKLTSSATYANARTGSITAARELYGVNSQEEASVTNAWFAVGVGAAFTGTVNGGTCNTATGLASSNVTASSATLSFTAVSGAASYNVRYKATSASTFTTVSSTSTSVAISGLAESTAYEFQVQTVCSGTSTSAFTASTNFTTTAASTACNAATGLAASNVTASSATLSFTAVSGAASYNVRYKATSAGTFTTVSSTGTSVAISGLASGTAYEYQVQTVCSGTSSSAYTSSANFTTTTVVVAYCASKGTSSTSEWIKQVKIGTINNATAANAGYGDFTSISTNLTVGSSNAITLTPGFSSGLLGANAYPEYWRVWVDFNKDGDFTDAGELAFDAGATSTTAVNGNLLVPATASLGSTRIRVQMKYNAASTSCETFAEGEVEDYTANIVAAGGFAAGKVLNTNNIETSFQLYPNPAEQDVNLILNSSNAVENVTIRLVDVSGKVILVQNFGSTPAGANTFMLPIQNLENGLYYITISADDYSNTKKVVVAK